MTIHFRPHTLRPCTIRQERPADEAAREALLDAAYGDARHAKPSATLRKGRLPASDLSLVAVEHGRIIGTVRLWPVTAGRGRDALLLGPLAVHPGERSRGIGAALMRRAIAEAARLGHDAVLLVGDLAYYSRFGFSAGKTGMLTLPGADPARLLGLELTAGALDGAQGKVAAAGERRAHPAFAAFKRAPRLVPQAA